jgi:hypothetical protein
MEYKPLIIMPNSHWVIDMLLELIDKADIKVENTAASEVMY